MLDFSLSRALPRPRGAQWLWTLPPPQRGSRGYSGAWSGGRSFTSERLLIVINGSNKKLKWFFVQVGDGVSELVLSCSRGLTSSHVRAFLRSCPNIRR